MVRAHNRWIKKPDFNGNFDPRMHRMCWMKTLLGPTTTLCPPSPTPLTSEGKLREPLEIPFVWVYEDQFRFFFSSKIFA